MDRPPPPQEPLLFDRIVKEKVWGGQRLNQLFQLGLSQATPIGETWELSDVAGDASRVRSGACAGFDLRQLMEHHSEVLLGRSTPSPAGTFPLLVKFVDAAADLSVQVHPPDGPKSPTGAGKTEAWYVLDADEDATVICGLVPGTSREEFEASSGSNDVVSYLHRVPVSPGDVVFVPAGQVHAIMGGVFLLEIQQTSDTTYRFWDWGRLGTDGKARELHLEQALDVVNYHLMPGIAVRAPFDPVVDGACISPLGRCPYFDLIEVRVSAPHLHQPSGYCSVVTVVGGQGCIEDPKGAFAPVKVTKGDVFLLPGTLGPLRFLPGNGNLELLEGRAR